jgi:hypothetical protein
MRRAILLPLALLVPLAAIAIWVGTTYFGETAAPEVTLPAPREPAIPDLVVLPLRDIALARKDDGSREIFFTATIANIGDGPFMLHAARQSVGGDWLVAQRFLEPDGTLTERATPGDLVYGGHGHDHWHVRLGASYALVALPTDKQVRRLVKAGFCFFDQKAYRLGIPNASPRQRFGVGTCNGPGVTALDMGLSVVWSDPYTWLLPDQRVDATGLAAGDYRLIATADPDGWFREKDETNNETWVDLRITERADGIPIVEVVRRSDPPA